MGTGRSFTVPHAAQGCCAHALVVPQLLPLLPHRELWGLWAKRPAGCSVGAVPAAVPTAQR